MALGDKWEKLRGTLRTIFQIGKGGPNIKASSGVVEFRNAADSAYADIRAALIELFGDDIVINAGAAGSGDDWTFTISRPSTGMTEDVQVIMPSDTPSPGMALAVASESSGVITLEWISVEAGNDKVITDTTSLAFGTSSPLSLFTLPANAVIHLVKVIVDTAFDGTAPTLSIGVSGTASKYMGTSDVDLKTAGIYEVDPGVTANGSTEALIATYAADSSAAGAARILVSYSIPS